MKKQKKTTWKEEGEAEGEEVEVEDTIKTQPN